MIFILGFKRPKGGMPPSAALAIIFSLTAAMDADNQLMDTNIEDEVLDEGEINPISAAAADAADEPSEGPRLPNWTSHENICFLEILEKVGFGKWSLVATELEARIKQPIHDRLARNPSYLRAKFNTLNGQQSFLRKEFAPRATPRFTGTKAQKAKQQEVHVNSEVQRKKEYEAGQKLLAKINGKFRNLIN
jgi:hypothetical protein